MTQIKDMRALRQGSRDSFGFSNQSRPTRHHVRGGEIALHAARRLQIICNPLRINTIVKSNAICTNQAMQTGIFLAGTARKGNDRNMGEFGL